METSVGERIKVMKETEKQAQERLLAEKIDSERRRLQRMKCEQERDERLRSRQQQEELIVSQQQISVEAGTNGGLDFEEKEANSESCVCNGGIREDMNPEEISHDSSLVKMDTDYQMEESVSDRVKRLKEAERQAKAKQEAERQEAQRRKSARLKTQEQKKQKPSINEDEIVAVEQEIEVECEPEDYFEMITDTPSVENTGSFKESEAQPTETSQASSPDDVDTNNKIQESVSDRIRRMKEIEKEAKAKQEAEKQETERRRSLKLKREQEKKQKGIVQHDESIFIQQENTIQAEIPDFTDTARGDASEDAQSTQEKEEILKERQLLEETEQAFLEYAKYQKSAPLPKLRSAMAAEEPDNGMMSDESSAEDEEEDVNLQEKLEEIDIEREGYDPDKERRMLEQAEEAFRSFASHKKGGSLSRQQRSTKTRSLIKSFTLPNADTSCDVTPSNLRGDKPTGICKGASVIDASEEIVPITVDTVSTSPFHTDNSVTTDQSTVKKDEDILVKAGLVKNAASMFQQPPSSPPHIPASKRGGRRISGQSSTSDSSDKQYEQDSLGDELRYAEDRVKECRNRLDKLNSQGRDEEALEAEEEYHAASLELSRIKRKALQIQANKTQSNFDHDSRRSSSSSGGYPAAVRSISESWDCTRAPSSMTKLSRECKAPMKNPPPAVDPDSFNDEGEFVPEGSVLNRLKAFEEESTKRRQEMAEMKKHLSLSRSSIDSGRSSDEPPLSLPQVKLSKECKSPMDRPIPPVDPQSFNDEGEIVVEGNVLQSVKIFESEAEKVRREKAELKKALSCSRTSLDSGHFSIEKPVPPVDPESFNDGGDCVLDGNVSSQIKAFEKVK